MDTITVRDPQNRPLPEDPTIHVIPVRFHMYWAGSDPDGAVVGFYWAVTETTTAIEPLTGTIPPVPGPKPSDYKYTTKTDTTFIFRVVETAPDRQHAFFLYAVDNQGKADPTPARFLFTAIDKYPPIPIFDDPSDAYYPVIPRDKDGAVAIQKIYTIEGTAPNLYLDSSIVVKYVDDQSVPRTFPRDTVAVNSKLRFRWRAQLGVAGSYVDHYCYKLEEPNLGCFGVTDSAVYGPGLSPGAKVFTVRAVDAANGARDSTRRMYVNYMPDTWFSGPDPAAFAQFRDANGDTLFIDFKGKPVTAIPNSLMGPDSFQVLPAFRPMRKTFFEIWNGRVYAHNQGDTLHMNSWVLFYNGGYDKDSPYAAAVDTLDPDLPQPLANYPVLVKGPANGSPIGFHTQLSLSLDLRGQPINFAQSGLYPVYEPTSVFRNLTIGGYWILQYSGKAFAVARAEDGDGLADFKVLDPRSAVDPDVRDREVLEFYINKSPFLKTGSTSFVPKADGSTVFNTTRWDLSIPSDDIDPYDPEDSGRVPGMPTSNRVLRYKITVLGKGPQNQDTTWVYEPPYPTTPYFFATDTQTPSLIVPAFLYPDAGDGNKVQIEIELCDCRDCEHQHGQGRCVSKVFDVTYNRPPDPPAPESSLSPDRGGNR